MKTPELLIAAALIGILTSMAFVVKQHTISTSKISDVRFKSEPSNPVSISTNEPYFSRAFYRIQGLTLNRLGASAHDIADIQKREIAGEKNAIMNWLEDHPLTPEFSEWLKQHEDERAKIAESIVMNGIGIKPTTNELSKPDKLVVP